MDLPDHGLPTAWYTDAETWLWAFLGIAWLIPVLLWEFGVIG